MIVSVKLLVMGWVTGIRFVQDREFSFQHVVQSGSGAHPVSYLSTYQSIFPQV
jgi:hypothetical protein